MVEFHWSDSGILHSFTHFKGTAHKNRRKKINDDTLNLQVIAKNNYYKHPAARLTQFFPHKLTFNFSLDGIRTELAVSSHLHLEVEVLDFVTRAGGGRGKASNCFCRWKCRRLTAEASPRRPTPAEESAKHQGRTKFRNSLNFFRELEVFNGFDGDEWDLKVFFKILYTF